MRLLPGAMAPELRGPDFLGRPQDLAALRGRPVLLSFYRYASCPLCNLRMRELILAHPRLQARGLTLLAVFQSPAASMAEYVGRQDAPFPLLPDPQLQHYRRWGVESRWSALLSPAAWGLALRAMAAGHWPGRIEGPVDRCPADFLIDAEGRIARAYYGRDIGDHLPLAEIEAWLPPLPAVAAELAL